MQHHSAYRSSFRDYAAEHTHTPHAVMEAALAHAVRNKAEAAYARSDLFPSLGGASRSLRAPAAAIVQVRSDSRAPPVAGFSVTSSVPY